MLVLLKDIMNTNDKMKKYDVYLFLLVILLYAKAEWLLIIIYWQISYSKKRKWLLLFHKKRENNVDIEWCGHFIKGDHPLFFSPPIVLAGLMLFSEKVIFYRLNRSSISFIVPAFSVTIWNDSFSAQIDVFCWKTRNYKLS